MTTQKLSSKTKRAIAKYGQSICVDAFEMTKTGDGARTIGYSLNLTTNQADAAIAAGRELATLATIKVGDLVAIRGDLRLRFAGDSQYTPDQLIDGKYLKHTGTGGVWTGRVQKIQGDEALVGGGWRHISRYEVYSPDERS